jgi:hypothetical protein
MLQLAVHFYEKGRYTSSQTKPGSSRKLKLFGYQMSKINYHILHRDLVEPEYHELTTTYLFQHDKQQTTARLGAHIQELVNIAVFPDWYPYLVQQGRLERLLTPCDTYGGVKLWKLILDRDAWERLICRGLSQSDICLPV